MSSLNAWRVVEPRLPLLCPQPEAVWRHPRSRSLSHGTSCSPSASAVIAIFWPVAALPGIVFSVLAIREGRGAQAALGVFAFLWVLVGGLLGFALNFSTDPDPLPPDSAVLSEYFRQLQNDCASGIGPDPSICQAALSDTGQKQILQSFGWYSCRSIGNDPRVCLAVLP